jgi:6-phosphogluconate dehydrogenase
MVGLGRMGANMRERLLLGNYTVVGYDPDSSAVQRVKEKGARGADSLADVARQLRAPRIVWLMVPRRRSRGPDDCGAAAAPQRRRHNH